MACRWMWDNMLGAWSLSKQAHADVTSDEHDEHDEHTGCSSVPDAACEPHLQARSTARLPSTTFPTV